MPIIVMQSTTPLIMYSMKSISPPPNIIHRIFSNRFMPMISFVVLISQEHYKCKTFFGLKEIKELLDEKYLQYNNPEFIETDPICIPHQFSLKENIEISAFLTATIAWGNRKSIIKNAGNLMSLLDNDPYGFIMNANDKDFQVLNPFCHRTFCGIDAEYFIRSLSNIYREHGGLETIFSEEYKLKGDIKSSMIRLREVFFELKHPVRTEKHVSNVAKGSSAKRLNMFLRWMIRKDDHKVDFGLWRHIPPSVLHIPLDVHSGNVARNLGLLKRKQNDWKSVTELTAILRSFDPIDPVKYDFALFGMGIFEGKP